MTADLGRSPALLARYLDQRRRMGEPSLVSTAMGPGEFADLAAAVQKAVEPRHDSQPQASATPERRAKRDRPYVGSRGVRAGESPNLDLGGVAARTPFPAQATSAASPTHPGASGCPAAENADYDELRELALACKRCSLSQSRTRVAFSDGSPRARLIVVGEAPGAEEDRTGLPFVGQAGRLLDLMLASVGLSRKDSVYICNVLKCRPPGNRNPKPPEIEACAPFLKRQLELVAPEVVLATGTFAAQWLTGSPKALGKLRGQVHSYQGVPLVATYHPAALLRNAGWSAPAWNDLQLLRQVMDQRRVAAAEASEAKVSA